MKPKEKKSKPKGTKITLKGRNKAEKSVSRYNKRGSISRAITRLKRENAKNVNSRRSAKAVKKGKVSTINIKRMDSPAKTKTKEVVKTPSRTVTETKKVYQPVDVRTKDTEKYGKERAKGVAPDPNHPLQKALAEARKNKKLTVKYKNKDYLAGKMVDKTTSKTIPAVTEKVTTKTPAKYSHSKKTLPVYKEKIPKLKTVKRNKGRKAVSVNGRVVKIKQ